MWCPNSTNLDTDHNIILVKTLINAAVPYAEREKVGGARKGASIYPKTIISFVIIVGGHPNLTNGLRKCQDRHSIRWWMRLRRVIMV